MCGVAGIFHADASRPVSPETLVAMAAIQVHRGPDGYGWRAQDDRGIGFSHARLSIIDLHEDRGRQPFETREGELLVTHNGEFYDYQRLRADLTSRGARFHTKSDTELLLHLYPRLGLEGALSHLRGEFAFALYDRAEDRLFLVRDRFGVKPLYYVQAGDTLVFGSEIKVLFAHPEVERRFDPEGLFHELMQTKVPGKTAFAGVHAVEPGCAVVVDRPGGSLRIKTVKYWDLDFPEKGTRDPVSDAEAIEGVRERLLGAVNLRLEADVPVACYLSGGIDSSAIIGLAAACKQDPVKAFTIGFDDAAYDETDIAREMAGAIGADQDVLTVDADHLYDHFERTLWHAETSIYNTFSVAKLLMSGHVHDVGYKVVVTGEGSDELFAGYPQLRRDYILHGLDDATGDERARLEAELRSSNALFQGALMAEKEIVDPALAEVVGFTPSSLMPWLTAARRVPALLAPDLRRELGDYQPGRAIAGALDGDQLRGRRALDRAQYVWIKTQFERQVLTWAGDRVDMANSMEARPAFLDHHLAEFAVTLPPKMRMRGNTDKWVLREAMVGLLPRRLYEREKFAFMAPPAHTDERKLGKMRGLAAELLSAQAIADAGALDAAGVEALFAELASPESSAGSVRLDALINHALSVQVLSRRLIQADVPRIARELAAELGWAA